MSNNRMWLVHKSSGKKILLCKYYPGTNWYLFHDEDKINNWFDEVSPANTTFGDTDFSIEYEIKDDHVPL